MFCPYGIDTAEVTMAAREILASVGMGQKYANKIIGKVHLIGNNPSLPPWALVDAMYIKKMGSILGHAQIHLLNR